MTIKKVKKGKIVTDKTEFLYQMYYKDDDGKDVVFYIGKTIDPDTRLKQHQKASKTGTEDKYVFIRELEAKNKSWDLKTFKEIPAGTHVPDYEHYYVIKYFKEGHPLTNMKHGDLMKKVLGDDWETTEFRSVDDVKAKRLEVEKVKNLVKSHKSKRLEYKILVEEIEKVKKEKANNIRYLASSIIFNKQDLEKMMEHCNKHTLYDDEKSLEIKKAVPGVIDKIKDREKDLKTIKKTYEDKIDKLENKRADILVNFYIDNVELINKHEQFVAMAKNYCWQTIEDFILMLLKKNFKSWEKAINDYKWNKTNISMKHIFIGKF